MIRAVCMLVPGRPASARRSTRRYSMARPIWALPAIAYLLAFFVFPLVDNAQRSLVDTRSDGTGVLFYYTKLLSDAYYLDIIWMTFKVSLLATCACLLLGYPIAYFMVRYAGRWRAVIVFFLIAPLLTSIIMRTFGWRVLLARRGILNVWMIDLGVLERPIDLHNDPIAVYLGLVHVLLPFMVLSIAAVLQGLDLRLEESALVLGAGRWQTFFLVTLPLSLDGVATGSILVFMLANGSFVTMLLLGGGKIVTIPLLIYQQFNLTQDVAFASAMGNVLLTFALIGIFAQMRLMRRRGVKG